MLWKVIAIIIHHLAESIKLHDFLHGFRKCRGTGTAILETKILQGIVGIVNEVLYNIFVDLKKANDAL